LISPGFCSVNSSCFWDATGPSPQTFFPCDAVVVAYGLATVPKTAQNTFQEKTAVPLFFIQSSQIAVLDLALNSKFLEANELGKDMVPKKIFFTKGVGKHRERLTSFELALRDAGIAAQNLVRVSSIFPPNCKLVPRSQGLTYLSPGEVVFAVVAENSTHEPHRLLASSIGVAIPADRNTYGYLSEHHSFGETEDSAGDYAEELAAEMLATTLNVEFDSDRSWDEKKEIYRISNKIVRTANVTQSAVGDKRGLWTTVIASAVLIFD
jgi:arginine decarboxylase